MIATRPGEPRVLAHPLSRLTPVGPFSEDTFQLTLLCEPPFTKNLLGPVLRILKPFVGKHSFDDG